MINNNVVAEIILEQMGGYGRLKSMVNVKNLNCTDNSLAFKFSGSRKINHVRVELKSDDTYKMEFLKVGKIDWKTVKEYDGIYCDMLVEIFEDVTGLYLSL